MLVCNNDQCIISIICSSDLGYKGDNIIYKHFDQKFSQCIGSMKLDIKLFLVKSFFIWELWFTQCNNN